MGIELTRQDGTTITVSADAIEGFQGAQLAPGGAGFEEARQIWNAMIDRRPGLIARCTGAADVAAAVRFANEHDLLVSVRGGGHNIAGSALCDGGLTIDLSAMRSVRVDAQTRRAWVEGGATLGDLDHATQADGLAVPVGINSTTGVAGLALGGGFGWLSRSFGHTADNIVAAEMVTADGEIRHVSDDEEPDLFWAIRGGGGNFGIVTTFEFRCHPVGPDILSGPVVHRLSDAAGVLRAYRDIARELPDEATCWSVLRMAPPLPFLDPADHGRPVLLLPMTYSGGMAEGEGVLAPLRAIGTPIGDGVAPHSFVGWQSAFDPLLGEGARNYWKSHDFLDLTDDVIDLAVDAAHHMPSTECEIFTAQLGGAAGRVPSDAIAFPHREHAYTLNVHGRWQDRADDQACTAWVRDLYAGLEPHATGSVYSNFMPEDEQRAIGPFGPNQARLEQIKAKYDPTNRFRTNINITPAEVAR